MEADQSAREKQGYGDGLTQALTLVVGPVLFGLLGAFIDSLLGTAPLFLIVLGLFGVLAAVVTAYYEYQGRIERHDEGKPWARTHAVAPAPAYEGEIARRSRAARAHGEPARADRRRDRQRGRRSAQRHHRARARRAQLPRLGAPHHLGRPHLARRGDGRGARRLHRAPRACCSASRSRSTPCPGSTSACSCSPSPSSTSRCSRGRPVT